VDEGEFPVVPKCPQVASLEGFRYHPNFTQFWTDLLPGRLMKACPKCYAEPKGKSSAERWR